MALVTKNDVTQIFAIQAPEVDLPPTFANYPRGWDTARSNNGKPTIKQFNYIQQRTDQNMLWIHQNGAALPYDATMEYAENAHVVKDGVLQQWKAGVWVKVTTWSSIEGKPELYTKTEADTLFIEAAQIGQPNGVAGLDVNGDLDPAQFPLATDTTLGIAEIATQAEVNTATDDARIITPLKMLTGVKNHLNATGDAPMFACRAWVNFNGTGTPTIRASGNVSSITDNGVGNYTINFTTAMPDSNYAVSYAAGGLGGGMHAGRIVSMAAGSINMYQEQDSANSYPASDTAIVTVAVFR